MKINKNIFKEYDIRGKYPEELDENTAYALGLSFAKLIKAKKVIIGRDARLESEKVFWPLVSGLLDSGVKVDDLGVCATPELFFAVSVKKYDAGCMVTASHSPVGQTGYKFCDGRGRPLLTINLKKLEALAGQVKQKFDVAELKKQTEAIDFVSVVAEYKKFALSFIKPETLKNLKIVLDASSGSGARLADDVFSVLPASSTFMNFRADDQYPDHGPNPLLPENQQSIIKEIKAERADLGVLFDGDADRAIFFDEAGTFVEPYYINCLLSEIILKKNKGIRLVVDARLNLGITATIKKAGGKALRHRSGFSNIINTMDQKKLLFGCENSGHFMFNIGLKKKANFVYGEAIIPVLLVASFLQTKKIILSQAIKSFKDQYLISGELNFKTAKFAAIGKILQKKFAGLKSDEIDGLSIFGPKGEWFFNLRTSHTEPVIRLNIEAKNQTRLDQLKTEIVAIINKF